MSRKMLQSTRRWHWLLALGLATVGCGRGSEGPAARPLVRSPAMASEPARFAGSDAVRLVPQSEPSHAELFVSRDATHDGATPVISLREFLPLGSTQTGPITPPIVAPTSAIRPTRIEPATHSVPRTPSVPPQTQAAQLPASQAPITSSMYVRSSQMQAAARQALEHYREGFSLANRAAYFSAREEFLETARIVARGLDADEGSTRHATALSAGLRALTESEDFVTRRTESPTRAEQLSHVIEGHQTPVLHDADLSTLNVGSMAQAYYNYAVDQLVLAVSPEPVGSLALYSLGKLYGLLAKDPATTILAADAKSGVLHHAAMLVDPNNGMAANELAVHSAAQGRYQDARNLLMRSLATSPQPGVWQNLAVVHARLGEADLSNRARQAALQTAGGADPADQQTWIGQQAVAWMPVGAFASTSEPPVAMQSTTAPAAATNAGVDTSSHSPQSEAGQPSKSLARLLPWRDNNIWNRNDAGKSKAPPPPAPAGKLGPWYQP